MASVGHDDQPFCLMCGHSMTFLHIQAHTALHCIAWHWMAWHCDNALHAYTNSAANRDRSTSSRVAAKLNTTQNFAEKCVRCATFPTDLGLHNIAGEFDVIEPPWIRRRLAVRTIPSFLTVASPFPRPSS